MAEKNYNRIMLGRSSCYAAECKAGNFIGADFDINEDLTNNLSDNWREFNALYIPQYLNLFPEKSRTAAGISMGFLWTICKGLKVGDVVLCPDGLGAYYVGTITSDYYYVPDTNLPHRRGVQWYDKTILRKDMSQQLKNSTGSIGTCCMITQYADEIEQLIGGTYTAHVEIPSKKETVKPLYERSLHKVFCNYLRSQHIFAKTIFHEKSTRDDSAQKWVHPDIIAASFSDFRNAATEGLLRATEPKKAVTVYSYEMKIRITSDAELKQCYFQALSNSSWANQGYLVAFDIEEGLHDEMKRLNDAFGIGIIRLQAKPEDTEILFPARERELDYNTIDKLNVINPDFSTFIQKLSKVMLATNEFATDVRAGFEKICDPTFATDEELETYCRENSVTY